MKRHALMLLVVLGVTRAASAQPAIEVRTSFGATSYQQNEVEYTAPAVRFAVRAGGRRFAVEPEVGLAWRSTTDAARQFRSFGVNAIARGHGRAAPFFGGGLGMYSERASRPRLGTQIVFGVDLRTTRRVAVFGQGRFEARPFGDAPGGTDFQGFAGVAVSLSGTQRRHSS